jgi:hypothetical protein
MSWRQSSGRETCNRCRRVVDLGAPLFVGPLTGATWCEADAGEVLGQYVDGHDLPVHAAPMVGLDEAGAGKISELRAKYAPKVARNWGDRDE